MNRNIRSGEINDLSSLIYVEMSWQAQCMNTYVE